MDEAFFFGELELVFEATYVGNVVLRLRGKVLVGIVEK